MELRLYFVVLIMLPLSLQAQDWKWSGTGGDPGDVANVIMKTDSAGNSYMTGFYVDPSINLGGTTFHKSREQGMFITKYDKNSNLIWATADGDGYMTLPFAIGSDFKGNCYVGGSFMGNTVFGSATYDDTGQSDFFLAKYDPEGNFVWLRQGGANSPSGQEYFTEIVTDSEGNIYACGNFQEADAVFGLFTVPNTGLLNGVLIKYDSSGTEQWVRNFPVSGAGKTSLIQEIAIDGTDNLYVGGIFKGTLSYGIDTLNSPDYESLFMAKFDKDGNLIWLKKDGDGNSSKILTEIETDQKGNFYILGGFQGDSTTLGTEKFYGRVGLAVTQSWYLAKYDTSGNFIWAIEPNMETNVSGSYGQIISMCIQNNGNLVLSGYYSKAFEDMDTIFYDSAPPNTINMVLVIYGEQGEKKRIENIGLPSIEYATGNGTDRYGGIYMCGSFKDSTLLDQKLYSTGFSYFIAKKGDTFFVTGSCVENDINFASFLFTPDDSITNVSWSFGDSLEDSGSNVSHRYDEPGNYTVTMTLTNMHGQVNRVTKNVTIQACSVATGLTGKDSSLIAKIYPNPTTGMITLEMSESASSLEIHIYSVTGVLQKSVALNNSVIQQVNLEDIQEGLYIYEILQNGERKAGGMLKIK